MAWFCLDSIQYLIIFGFAQVPWRFLENHHPTWGASKQTLLAPTDDAFMALGRGVAASLLCLVCWQNVSWLSRCSHSETHCIDCFFVGPKIWNHPFLWQQEPDNWLQSWCWTSFQDVSKLTFIKPLAKWGSFPIEKTWPLGPWEFCMSWWVSES